MILRDNADDYAGDIRWLQSWTLLGDVECPPSFEVFEHGWELANHERPHVSPQQYAHALVAKYARTDSDRKQGQPWWRWSEMNGRLVSA